MKILVTGGAGFIGSNIVKRLLERDHEVHVLDNLSTGNIDTIPSGVEFFEGNVGDKSTDSIIKNGYDAVCHHAAQINVRISLDDPLSDIRNDVEGAVRLLESCIKHEVKHVTYASSGGAIYGDQEILPTPEDVEYKPESPYGINKLMIENYLRYYNKIHGLKYTALRYANVYGPGQNSKSEAGVVSIFLNQMIENGELTIFGSGEQTRDFVYVTDVVNANISAIENGISGEFNIGTSNQISINELFNKLKEIAGYDKDANHGDAVKGELLVSVLNISKAMKGLNWSPEVSLDEGLKKTYKYFSAVAV